MLRCDRAGALQCALLTASSARLSSPNMQDDPRKAVLTRLALEAVGASSPAGRWAASAAEMTASLHSAPAMQEFLEQPAVATLQVSVITARRAATNRRAEHGRAVEQRRGDVGRRSSPRVRPTCSPPTTSRAPS